MPFHFEEIPSTQSFLKDLVQKDPSVKHLEYAIADSQTEGQARHGRNWVSDKGNLFLSVWLKDHALPLTWIPHWIGVALIQSLTELGVPAGDLSLKWPNDVMTEDNQKVAGILCEKIGDGVVAGIGVNLVTAPNLEDREAASIHSFAPQINFERLHIRLAEKLIEHLKKEPEISELHAAYDALSMLKTGRLIYWTDLYTKAEGHGIFLRYGEFGELMVSENGKDRSLYSEEIRIRV